MRLISVCATSPLAAMPPSMICGSAGSCTRRSIPLALAAAARPLAVDVAMHEELRRHDVQAFADVLADAAHRLPAVLRLAGGVLGLVAVFDATQVFGQGLAARAPARCFRRGRRLGQGCLQRGELRLEVGLVLQQRVLEHLALLDIHRLALGAELPALQTRQLEVDLLELRIAPGDVAVLALDQLLLDIELSHLLLDALEHLRGQRREVCRRQNLQVLRLEIAHAEHASHDADARRLTPLEDVLSTCSRPALLSMAAMLTPA